MPSLRSLSTGLATVKELLAGLWSGPFWWLVPVLLFLLPLSVLFLVLKAVPVLAPFVYTAF